MDLFASHYDEWLDELRESEGLRLSPYQDPENNTTIGYGFNLDQPGAFAKMYKAIGVSKPEFDLIKQGSRKLTKEEADRLLNYTAEDAAIKSRQLVADPTKLPEPAQKVLADLTYNLGPSGARGFQNTLALIEGGKYPQAAQELLNSDYARQVPARAQLNANRLLAASEAQTPAKAALEELPPPVVQAPSVPEREQPGVAEHVIGKVVAGQAGVLGAAAEGLGSGANQAFERLEGFADGYFKTFGLENLVSAKDEFFDAFETEIEDLLGMEEGEDYSDSINPFKTLAAVGDSIQQSAQRTGELTNRDSLNDSFWGTTMPQAFGSLLGLMAGGGAAGATVLGATSMGRTGYEDAKASGATEENAQLVGMIHGLIGTTEAIGAPSRLYKFVDELTPGLKQKLLRALTTGSLEGAQEAVSNIAQTTTINPFIKEQRDILSPEAAEEGAAGFVLGALLDVLLPGKRRGDRREPPPAKDQPGQEVSDEAGVPEPESAVEEDGVSEIVQEPDQEIGDTGELAVDADSGVITPEQEAAFQDDVATAQVVEEDNNVVDARTEFEARRNEAKPKRADLRVDDTLKEERPALELVADNEIEDIELEAPQGPSSQAYRDDQDNTITESEELGRITVQSQAENGSAVATLDAQRTGEGVQIKRIDAAQEGTGAGSAAHAAFVKQHLDAGDVVLSDASLTPAAVKLYEKLEGVERNPEVEESASGGLRATNPDAPWVFKVAPTPEQAAEKTATTLNNPEFTQALDAELGVEVQEIEDIEVTADKSLEALDEEITLEAADISEGVEVVAVPVAEEIEVEAKDFGPDVKERQKQRMQKLASFRAKQDERSLRAYAKGRDLVGRIWRWTQGRRSKPVKGEKKPFEEARRNPVEQVVHESRGEALVQEAQEARFNTNIEVTVARMPQAHRQSALAYFQDKKDGSDLTAEERQYIDVLKDIRTKGERALVDKGVLVRRAKDGTARSTEEMLDLLNEKALEGYARRWYDIASSRVSPKEWVQYVKATRPDDYRALLEFLNTKAGKKYVKGTDSVEIAAQDIAAHVLRPQYRRGKQRGDVTHRETSPLLRRRDIPAEVRRFWGEVTDPAKVMTRTLAVQSSLLLQTSSMSSIADVLFDHGLAIRSRVKGKHDEWVPFDKGAKHKQHPLYGVFVPKHVYQAVHDPEGLAQAGRAHSSDEILLSPDKGIAEGVTEVLAEFGRQDWYASANSRLKALLILGNFPGSYIKNAVSAPLIAAAAGAGPVSWAKGFRDGVLLYRHKKWISERERYKDKLGSLPRDEELRLEKLLRNRIPDESAISEEITNQIEKVAEDPAMSWLLKQESVSPRVLFRNLSNMVDRGVIKAGALFSIADTMGRAAVFYHEEQAMLKSGLSETAAEKEAGIRARRKYPTYSTIPVFFKALNNMPISAFLSFTVAMGQTISNNAVFGARDFATGVRTNNAYLAAHGLRGLATSTTLTLFGAEIMNELMQGLFNMLGWSDEDKERDEQARNVLRPEYSKGKLHLYADTDEGTLEFNTTDYFPYAYGDMIRRTLQETARQVTAGEEVNWLKSTKLAIEPLTDPVIGTESPGAKLFRAGLSALHGFQEGDSALLWEGIDEMITLAPGSTRASYRVLTGTATGDKMTGLRGAGGLGGVTPLVQHPKDEGQFKLRDYADRTKFARSEMNTVLFDDNLQTSEIAGAVRDYIDVQVSEQKELRAVIDAMLRSGMKVREVKKALTQTQALTEKEFNRIRLGKTELRGPSFDRLREKHGSAVARKIRQEFRRQEKKADN